MSNVSIYCVAEMSTKVSLCQQEMILQKPSVIEGLSIQSL